jgi:TolB-like protein
VFLSYASQDAEAAARICNALRAAGIEVWFDQSELRGGDAWDRQIRKQIHDCRLFLPVISAHTEARVEGYFRREWKLAVDRTHDLSERVAFLVPIVIDDTPEAKADVPDAFRHVQWTRLRGGEATPAFISRIAGLLNREETPSASSAASAPAASPLRTEPKRSRHVWLAVGLSTVIVVLGSAYYFLGQLHNGDGQRETAGKGTASEAVSAIPEKSIAVLPFADMSEKKDQEYFSDGLSEELIDMLTKIPELRVPARTSSFYFKGKSETIVTIARALGVANVLEGSVRKAGNQLRVTAQLIRADNGYHLWSETYDRELKDVFKVQDEIAGAVVSALKVKLAAGQQAAHGTTNTEAYAQYLLARQLYFRSGDVAGFDRAISLYRGAIALDPNYAAAYAGLAMARASRADLAELGKAVISEAAADAERAIALAPRQPDGYLARAYLRMTWGCRKVDSSYFGLAGIAMAECTLGHATDSRRALETLIASGANAAAYQISQVFSWCGDKDRAFQWLDRAYRQRDGGLAFFIEWDPIVASLHNDSRYTALLRKLNLPERAAGP